ncbi:MAG: ThuA domain-containing protein [Blastocatellia bacterium]
MFTRRLNTSRALLLLPIITATIISPTTRVTINPAVQQPRVLVFSRTTGFRHDSIPDGIAAIRQLGQQNNFDVEATEDASTFTDTNLSRYQTVVFLNTTGDALDNNQQAAFQQYIRQGARGSRIENRRG